LISRIVLDTDDISVLKDGEYILCSYNGSGGLTLVWNRCNQAGLCVCLCVSQKRTHYDVVHLEGLFGVDNDYLYLPLEKPNQFNSYCFRSYRRFRLAGIAFRPPVEEDRLKIIRSISCIVLQTSNISESRDEKFVFYSCSDNATLTILWDSCDDAGLCVCLFLNYRPSMPPLIKFSELYIVDSVILYLPCEPANKFKSYGLKSHNIQEKGVEFTLDLAKKLKKSDRLSDYESEWEYISKLIDFNHHILTLRGIKRRLICSDYEALIAITRFISCRAVVSRNSNGTYSAFSGVNNIYETIYDWKIDGDDFTYVTETDVDHSEDRSLSVSDSRPQTPLPGVDPLRAHLIPLLTRIDTILNTTLHQHLSMRGQIQSPPHR
jgi:hypothetical protein